MDTTRIATEIVRIAKELTAASPYDHAVTEAVNDLAEKYMEDGEDIPKNEAKKAILSIAKKFGKDAKEVDSDFWETYHNSDFSGN